MKKGETVHTENQLPEPVGPSKQVGRAEQPRKPSARTTVYRKPSKLDLSTHEASILSEEGIRADASEYLKTLKH